VQGRADAPRTSRAHAGAPRPREPNAAPGRGHAAQGCHAAPGQGQGARLAASRAPGHDWACAPGVRRPHQGGQEVAPCREPGRAGAGTPREGRGRRAEAGARCGCATAVRQWAKAGPSRTEAGRGRGSHAGPGTPWAGPCGRAATPRRGGHAAAGHGPSRTGDGGRRRGGGEGRGCLPRGTRVEPGARSAGETCARGVGREREKKVLGAADGWVPQERAAVA
jgi:hypothetical protein